MPFPTAYALAPGENRAANARTAATVIAAGLDGHDLAAVLYFAATDFDPYVLAADMRDAFPGVRTFGCTTAGEFIDGRMLRRSVVAMGFTRDDMDLVAITGFSDIDAEPDVAPKALANLEQTANLAMRDLDFREYAGFMLVDGLASTIDHLIERVGELTDVIFTGGCAADDGRAVETLVFADGRVYSNGAVFALMKPRRGFRAVKTQSIERTSATMVATRVDVANRIIYEFDGRPAVEAYAKAMGLDPAALAGGTTAAGAKNLSGAIATSNRLGGAKLELDPFIQWPLAVSVNGEPFIRSAFRAVSGGGVQMLMPPIEGVRYTVTRARDIADDMRDVVENTRRELGGLSAVIGADCQLRTRQITTQDCGGEYGEAFDTVPTLMFSSYGEIYVGLVSQSASMLFFA